MPIVPTTKKAEARGSLELTIQDQSGQNSQILANNDERRKRIRIFVALSLLSKIA